MQRDRVWTPPWPTSVDTVVLTLAAVVLAAPRLDSPSALVFDEIFYVSDAVSHVDVGVGQGFQAHPPLGTWLIASGIAMFGRSPAAWRAAPLVLGVLSIALLHRMALRVLPDGPLRRPLAATAALLLMTDGSWFVLSRTAMLDGPLTTLVLATVLTALVAVDERAGAARIRRFALTGVLAGAATAVKWSGALGLVIALVVVVLGHRRDDGRPSIHMQAVVTLLCAAALSYAAAWVPFALHRDDVPIATCPADAAPCVQQGGLEGVLAQHAALVRYHATVEFEGGYESDPSLWPLSYRPVTLHRSSCDVPRAPVKDPFSVDGSCPPEAVPGEDPLTYVGNPAVWLLFLTLLPMLAAAARRGDRAARVALAGWALQWLPWLVVTRSSFLYYMAPAVPFMALGAVVAANVVPRLRPVLVVLTAGLTGIVGLLVSLLPGVAAGVALIGWGVGGAVAVGNGPPLLDDGDRANTWITGIVAAVAALTFVVMFQTWTGGA